MAYECVPRPNCPACNAEWDDEMVALFDMALGLGCSCCMPMMAGAVDVPDIVCHQCGKVLYTTKPEAAPCAPAPDQIPQNPVVTD